MGHLVKQGKNRKVFYSFIISFF